MSCVNAASACPFWASTEQNFLTRGLLGTRWVKVVFFLTLEFKATSRSEFIFVHRKAFLWWSVKSLNWRNLRLFFNFITIFVSVRIFSIGCISKPLTFTVCPLNIHHLTMQLCNKTFHNTSFSGTYPSVCSASSACTAQAPQVSPYLTTSSNTFVSESVDVVGRGDQQSSYRTNLKPVSRYWAMEHLLWMQRFLSQKLHVWLLFVLVCFFFCFVYLVTVAWNNTWVWCEAGWCLLFFKFPGYFLGSGITLSLNDFLFISGYI